MARTLDFRFLMKVLGTNRAQTIYIFSCRHLPCIPVFPHSQHRKNVNGLGSLPFMQAAARHQGNPGVGKNIIKIAGHFFNLLCLQVKWRKGSSPAGRIMSWALIPWQGECRSVSEPGFSPFLPKAGINAGLTIEETNKIRASPKASKNKTNRCS